MQVLAPAAARRAERPMALVAARASETPDLTDVAEAARAALVADAAVVLKRCAGGEVAVLGAAGFRPAELVTALDAAAGRRPGRVVRGPSSAPGFPVGVAGESALWGAATVAVWVLRRTPEPFDNAGLTIAFARHAAVAVAQAVASDPPRAVPEGGPARERFARRVLDGLAEAELPGAVAERLAPAMGEVEVALRVWNAGRGKLETVVGSSSAEPEAVIEAPDAARAQPGDGAGWDSCAARVFTLGRTYLSNAVLSDPGIRQSRFAPEGLRRLLVVPLGAGGRRIGVLEVAGKDDDFDLGDVRTAEAIAAEIALAVVGTLERSRLQRRVRLEEILGACARAVVVGRNLQDFVDATLADMGAATGAAVVALVPRRGAPVRWRRSNEASPLERVFIGEARGAGAVRAYEIPARRASGLGWAVVHLPVQDSDGERLATLSVLRHHARGFDRHEREALSRLAGLFALAWGVEAQQLRRAEVARRAERRRLGDQLHEQVAQLLFAASLRLDAALEAHGGSAAVAIAEVERARGLVQRADRSLREVVQELADRGPDDLELLLGAVATAVEDEFACPVQPELAPAAIAAAAALPPSATAVLVKVAREGLADVAEHAGLGPLAMRLRLTRRGRLLLTVSAHGGGGPEQLPERRGLSLLRRAVAREGGVLRVRRLSSGATTIGVSLPL